MRKNPRNDKVLRAITIGLAAMMATTSMPLTVLADDTEPAPEPEKKSYSDTEETKSESADEARESVDDTAPEVNIIVEHLENLENIKTGDLGTSQDTEGNTVDNVDALVNADKEDGVEGSAIQADIAAAETALAAVDANLTIVENNEGIKGTGFEEAFAANLNAYKAIVAVYGVDGPTGEAAENFGKLKDWIFGYAYGERTVGKYNGLRAEAAIKEAAEYKSETAANADVVAAVTDAGEIAKAAKAEQEKADNAGNDAEAKAAEAEQTFTDLLETINTAPTIADANTAYDDLVKALDDAEFDIDAKQTIYDNAQEAYEQLLEDYKAKQKAVADAQEAYNEAASLVDKFTNGYVDLVDAHDKKQDNLRAHNTNLDLAKTNVGTAESALQDAADRLALMSQALNAAKTAIMADEGNAILAAVDVASSTSRNWDEEEALFNSIIMNYYVPQVLEADEVVGTPKWTKISVDGSDGDRNYFALTYKKGDDEQTIYLDYVMADKDGSEYKDASGVRKNGKSSSQIIIFKKTPNEKLAADAEAAALKKKETALLYDNADITVDRYKVIDTDGKAVYLNKDYVDGELNKDQDEAAIVNINGIYFKKGDDVGTATYYESTGIVVSDTDEDVATEIIVNGTPAEEYTTETIEGTDKVVKTYTADVTTITYHKSLADSSVEYDSRQSDTALADAQADLDGIAESLGDRYIDGDVVVTEHHDAVSKYVATGTYVPVFSETINIDQVYQTEWGSVGDENDKKNAIEGVYNQYKNEIEKNYVILGSSGTKKLDGTVLKDGGLLGTIGSWFTAEKVQVTGSITFTYVTQDYYYANRAQCNDLVNNDGNIKEGHLKKMASVAVESAEGATEDAAKQAFMNKIGANVYANGIDVTTEDKSTAAYDLYGFTYSYWDEDSRVTKKTETVRKDTYTNTQKVYGDVIQNQDGETLLVQATDVKFNDYLNKVKEYNALVDEVKAAQEKVTAAQTAVNNLKSYADGKKARAVHGLPIYDITKDITKDETQLDDLAAFVKDAEAKLQKAKEDLAALKDRLAEAEAARDARIAALTPAPSRSRDEARVYAGGDDAGAGVYVAPVAAPVVFPGIALPDAGVAGVRIASTTGRGGAGRDTEDAGVAGVREDGAADFDLVAKPDDTLDKKVADKKKTVTIKDEAPALAANPLEEQKNMNWWWLLIIAALGATGYEMYKKNQEKKAEKAAVADSLKKEN